tara:strand:+ start:305 stop:514 length:210 start_codon:yes stop_codon:yes gene_type:complete
MVLDIVAITSIALSGTAMLLQTLFTSRCSQVRCCGEDGCLVERKVMNEDEVKNIQPKLSPSTTSFITST